MEMTRERFAEILREYDYTERQIALLWNTKPQGLSIDEGFLRKTARHIQPDKDRFVQE